MDSLTHLAVGLAIAAISGEPMTLHNPALWGCVTGAVLPDGDIVAQVKGDYTYLKHHRGFSHALLVLPVYAAAIAAVLGLFFVNMDFQKVMMMTLAGCLSHVLLDITNSYGAQIFWPFSRKKTALDLLLIYDPVLIILCVLAWIPYTRIHISASGFYVIFTLYLLMRYLTRRDIKKMLLKKFASQYEIVSIRVLPSMFGFFKWNFIFGTRAEKVIGEVDTHFFNRKRTVGILRVMQNLDETLYKKAMETRIAKYFRDFTPTFHVACERIGKDIIFRFIDLRYFVAKDFLHYATAVLTQDFKVVRSLFHPYRKGMKSNSEEKPMNIME